MSTDPVVAEIRNIRERLAAQFAYDVQALVKDAQQRDATGDRTVVRREPRPPIQSATRPAKTA